MSALLTLTFVSALLSLPRVDIYDLRLDFIFEMIRAILLELHFGDFLVTRAPLSLVTSCISWKAVATR